MNKPKLTHAARWASRVLPALMALALFAAPSFSQTGRGQGSTPPSGNVVDLSMGTPVPGHYIIVLQDTVANPAAAASDLARIHGLGVSGVYAHALKGFAAQVPAGRLNALSRDPRIKFIEADKIVQAFAQTTPTGIRRILAPSNPNITINGVDDLRIDVDVAVIDTGISNHPDLNVSTARNVDCTSGTCAAGGTDDNGHGTHVSGTIAAIDNGSGVVGVAPGARLWGIKVLNKRGSGTTSAVIAGIDWVTAHVGQVKVANMSLGGSNSTAMCTAVFNSVAAGVTHVVAAGNSNADAANDSPANCYKTVNGVGVGAIAVSAIADYDGLPGGLAAPTCANYGADDTKASFSNWSTTIPLIAAPGVCILSTWLNGGYNTISGTSMATPHVTGAAALLIASGTIDPTAIRAKLNANGNTQTLQNGGWTDTSGDGVKEPLLDVSSTTDFAPAAVPGTSGGSGDTTPPTVSITSPTAGSVSGSVPVQITASDNVSTGSNLVVTWKIDSGPAQSAPYASGTTYAATWDTTTAIDGDHVLSAQATDGANNTTTSLPVTVTVNNGTASPATSDGLQGDSITWSLSGGKTGNKNLNMAMTIVDNLGNAVNAAGVSITVTNNKGGLWNGSGTTASNGTLTFVISNAPPATYTITINSVTALLPWDGVQPTDPTFTK